MVDGFAEQGGERIARTMSRPRINDPVEAALNRIIDTGLVVVTIGLVVVLTMNVFMRYVLSKPLYWSEETSLFGIVFITFVGGAVLVRTRKNIAIPIIYEVLSERVTTVIDVVTEFVTLFVIGFVFYQTILLVPRMATSVTPTMRVTEALYPAIAGFGYLFMLYYQIRNIVGTIRRLSLPQEGTKSAHGKAA